MAAANGLRNPGANNQLESDRHLDQVWEKAEVCYKFVCFNKTWKHDEMNLEHEYYAEQVVTEIDLVKLILFIRIM